MRYRKTIYLLLFLFLLADETFAFIKSGICDPYYASIKSNKANSHRGPGKEYKISFEYIQKGMPVMIIAKYDHWRKIKDPFGSESWIHKSLLSSKRFVMTTNNTSAKLMSDSNDNSNLIALIKKNVIMELIAVRGKWCEVKIYSGGEKYRGWIKKSDVFGVFDNEIR